MSRRRNRIVPFTLTEIFGLLFFALLLGLIFQRIERGAVAEHIREYRPLMELAANLGPEGARALAQMLRSAQDSIPKDFRELVLRVTQDDTLRNVLQPQLSRAGLNPTFLNTASTKILLDSMIARYEQAEIEIQAFRAARQFSDSPRDIVEGLTRALGQAMSQLEKAEKERQDLKNQLTHFQRRAGNGLDHPPCWADRAGRPEYALRITLFTEALTVDSIWPPHRAGDARQVDGMLQVIGQRLSWAEFSRRAAPILRWSQRQEPECRHFVILVDSVIGGKEAFKRGMLTVEHFFYKFLAN